MWIPSGWISALQGETASRSVRNRLSSLLLFAAVAAAPLPYGSIAPTTIAFWCAWLGIALLAASMRDLDRRRYLLLALAALVVIAYAFVLHEQFVSGRWLPVASPHPVWEQASKVLGIELPALAAIARNQPVFALGSPLAGMLALVCGFVVGSNRDRARQLLYVVAWSGAIYAAYGILAYMIDPTSVLWREKTAHISALTATFVNRNTAAVYFGSCSALWLLLLWERVRRRLPGGPLEWRAIPGRLFSHRTRGAIPAAVMLFLCLTAMFMTDSRAGVLVSLFGLVIASTAYVHRDLPRGSGRVVVLLGAVAVALVLLQFVGGKVNRRFEVEGVAGGGRFETYRATLRMIAEHPWFGTGQGTFAWSYPAYRSSDISMWGVWDRAHSTPLEVAAELGLPLAALIDAGWLVMVGVLIYGARTRQRDRIIPVSALSVAIIATLHSLIDFSLQIPGYAIVALAIVGAGLAQSFRANGGRVVRRGGDANAAKRRYGSQAAVENTG